MVYDRYVRSSVTTFVSANPPKRLNGFWNFRESYSHDADVHLVFCFRIESFLGFPWAKHGLCRGWIQDFKLGGELKKIAPSGGANIFGVFRVKNHDFTLCHLCKRCYLLVSATPPKPLNGFPWNIQDFPIAKHGLHPFQRLWGVRYIFVSFAHNSSSLFLFEH